MRKLTTAVAAIAAALALAASGCSNPSAGPQTGQPTGTAASKTLVVFAAASMKTTFTSLGKTFEGSHPGTKVTFNFAGSQTLVDQIKQGAPADVFASADQKNMTAAVSAGLVKGDPVLYASNQLTIVVPADNPAGITSFKDLTKKGIKLVLCASAVPCGSATKTIEKATGITLTPVSEEQAVTDVLAKVQAGEADAGLVYVTDVKSAGSKVKGIAFPESDKAVNHNPIAILAGAKQPELASEFVSLITGPEGQKVFSDAGFGKP